jgi:hypothetical protein
MIAKYTLSQAKIVIQKSTLYYMSRAIHESTIFCNESSMEGIILHASHSSRDFQLLIICCRFIRGKNSAVAQERLALFGTVPVFKDLPGNALKALALICTPRTFSPNTVILNQDQETDDLYVIAFGEVKLIRELPMHQNEGFEMKEFLKEDQSKDLKEKRRQNKKFAHVVSPVQQYCAEEPDNCKLRAHRKRILASARVKV